jgi:Flp pilus assembly secretin CpaC
MLASAYARRGAQDSSQQDNDRARVLYEEFLGLAPPDDRRIPRVRAILSGDTSSRGTPPAGQSMLKAGRDAEAHSPQAARRWYQAVIEYAPESEAADEARDRLGALAQAQGAARLTKITSSPIGAEIIVDGERTGRRTPVLPRSPLEVTPGRHVIEFEFNGRRSRPLEIDASPGDNATVLRAEIPLADEAGAALPPEGAPLVLARGAVRTLRLDGIITRVAVGDASVADGRTVGRSTVVVFGLQRGRTTVMVWTETGQQSFLVEVR